MSAVWKNHSSLSFRRANSVSRPSLVATFRHGCNETGSALRISDTDVTSVHARVSLAGNAVVVEDLGSTNGTFVNAKRITSAVTLREGSVLRVGRQNLKYERHDRAEVARAQELSRDLLRAADYVHSILPPPIQSGPVTADSSPRSSRRARRRPGARLPSGLTTSRRDGRRYTRRYEARRCSSVSRL